MTTPQLMAIAAGVVELAGGLMIAANIGTRIAALALIVFTGAATSGSTISGPWRRRALNNMTHALKNLSLIGALLVFFVIGPWRPDAHDPEPASSVSDRGLPRNEKGRPCGHPQV